MQLAIYAGNIIHKNRRKRGEKEHTVGSPRDVQYYCQTEEFKKLETLLVCTEFFFLHKVCYHDVLSITKTKCLCISGVVCIKNTNKKILISGTISSNMLYVLLGIQQIRACYEEILFK